MSEEQGPYVSDDTHTTLREWGKPIRCPECKEIIGRVIRRSRIRTLRVEAGGMVFETSMEAHVWCRCGGLLHWHAGQEAIDELVRKLESYHRRDAGNGEQP